MFDYEMEIITSIEESSDHELQEYIKSLQSVMDSLLQIREILTSAGEEMFLKFMLGIITILLAIGIFGIQISLLPISVIAFLTACFIIFVFVISLLVVKISFQSWIDVISEETVQDINALIKAKGIQIIDTETELFPNSQRYVRKVIETMPS